MPPSCGPKAGAGLVQGRAVFCRRAAPLVSLIDPTTGVQRSSRKTSPLGRGQYDNECGSASCVVGGCPCFRICAGKNLWNLGRGRPEHVARRPLESRAHSNSPSHSRSRSGTWPSHSARVARSRNRQAHHCSVAPRRGEELLREGFDQNAGAEGTSNRALHRIGDGRGFILGVGLVNPWQRSR